MTQHLLHVFVQPAAGQEAAQFCLPEGEHLVGRDATAAIPLHSESVSRRHALLIFQSGQIAVEDLSSGAGTLVGGTPITGRVSVASNQSLCFGPVQVVLQVQTIAALAAQTVVGQGRYQLLRMLGRGGRGEVWQAQDLQLAEVVALKFLAPELAADPSALAELKRETQKSRRLTHPNIIRLHDLVQPPGEAAFIALEFIDGMDLSAMRLHQPQERFAWAELEPLMVQLCDALECAHAQQVIHRDLKPANLMLDMQGRLKLADFGIAATMADSLNRVSVQPDGSGTVLYMSPQQMMGEPPRATDDLYALGATLCELLAGCAPFYTGDIQSQVLHRTAPPLREQLAAQHIADEVPEHIHQLIDACLAKDAAQRPQSAVEFRARMLQQPPPAPTQADATAPRSEDTWEKVEAALRRVMPAPVRKWLENHPPRAREFYTLGAIVAAWLAVEAVISLLVRGNLFGHGIFRPF